VNVEESATLPLDNQMDQHTPPILMKRSISEVTTEATNDLLSPPKKVKKKFIKYRKDLKEKE